MSDACCPTCGQVVRDLSTLLVSTDGCTVARYGITAHLTPQQGSILATLRKRYPAHATHDTILTDLYWTGRDEPEWSRSVLGVQVHRLRAELAPLGIAIENVWHAGFRLVFHDKPIERAAA